jgi:hypothetical protein
MMHFGGSSVTSGRNWFLHHDNAPSHTSLVVAVPCQEEHSCHHLTTVLTHLVLSDFWLLPALKIGFKGTRIATMDGIRLNVTAKPWKILKEAFHQSY